MSIEEGSITHTQPNYLYYHAVIIGCVEHSDKSISQKTYFKVPKTGATSTSEICGTKNLLA